MQICEKLCLNPQTLVFKEFSEFAEPDVNQTIQQIRFKYYNEKRNGKVLLIIVIVTNSKPLNYRGSDKG